MLFQLSTSDFLKDIPLKSCAFTGHRTLREGFDEKNLKNAVLALIERGVDTFYNGMAKGFDLLAAETVLSFKDKYPSVKLIACIPYYGQEKNYLEEDKKRYLTILNGADQKIILSDRYYKGCMHVRNNYMADRADVLVAYLKEEKGGTASTVKYFKRKKNAVIFID